MSRLAAHRLVAGVDCSTQRTKVIVVDPDEGQLAASGSAAHTVHRDGPRSESDPQGWLHALGDALATTGRASEIASIAIAAQQLGLVVLDSAGRPLRRAILWDDTRSAREARELEEALGGAQAWVKRVGSLPKPGLTVASWAWLRRHEPHVAEQVATVRLPHDYLTERLTGMGVTDRGDASGTGWWSVRHNDYAPEVLDLPLIGLGIEQLPVVLGPDTAAGETNRAAADAIGLCAGTLVAGGTGDNMAAALALAVEPGQPVLSLGTSGTLYVRSSVPAADPTGRIFAHASASGDHLPLACTLNATTAVDRVAELLGTHRDDVPQRTNVVVMPYFGGERLPDYPNATGTITGLDHATTRGEILLATYEGVAASLLEALDVLAEQSSGIPADAPITLIGGGARGRVWRRTIQRFSGRALQVPEMSELVAWGAAAQAAAVLDGTDAVSVARRWRVARGTFLPPVPIDESQLARIAAVRSAAEPLNQSHWSTGNQET